MTLIAQSFFVETPGRLQIQEKHSKVHKRKHREGS